MCPLFGKKKKTQRFLKEQAGEAEGRQRERAGSLSRFPNALELYSFSTLCSSRLRILVSIWGNGSAQGTRIVHGHRPELPKARASLSGSAPCPPALNRLRSRRSDPTFRASAQPSAPSPTPLCFPRCVFDYLCPTADSTTFNCIDFIFTSKKKKKSLVLTAYFDSVAKQFN